MEEKLAKQLKILLKTIPTHSLQLGRVSQKVVRLKETTEEENIYHEKKIQKCCSKLT